MASETASQSPVSEVTDSQRKMRGPITEYLLAKEYLNKHKIPQMFDSLMAALMLEKPEDHFQYLDSTLEKVKEIGAENINWETFVYDLHPLRDPNRLDYVHDEFYEKYKSSLEPSSDPPTEEENSYQPQVFQLTEPLDDEDEDFV